MAVLFPLTAMAQNRPQTFEQLQQKYIHQDGYTMVHITSDMLKMTGMDDIASVHDIRILTADKFSEDFVFEMARVTYQTGYKLLTKIEGKDQKARFFFRTTASGGISDLVMVAWGPENNLIMDIRGDFSMAQIRSIANQVSPVKPAQASNGK